MSWLFVTGVALDISGALLVVGAILRSTASDVGRESLTVIGYSGQRIVSRTNDRAYAWVGAFLLLLGFLLQLVAHALNFDALWLLAVGAAVITAATLFGIHGARLLANKLEADAKRTAQALIDEADRRAGLKP